MFDEIKRLDKNSGGLCRVMSGYGFPYTKRMRDQKGQKAKQDYDFMIDGVKYSWNDINGNFATDPKCLNLVGSVITCQGFDLNYAGVILSKDIKYNPDTKKIEADIDNYHDTHGKISKDRDKTVEDILNSYLVLLTRGIKGTFVYAYDENLRNYLHGVFQV